VSWYFLLTLAAWSPRSSVAVVRALATRSPTVKRPGARNAVAAIREERPPASTLPHNSSPTHTILTPCERR
jgi:hypothetical protein